MALLSARGGNRSGRAAAVDISSRLLPRMLEEDKLAALGTVSILDFGRANAASLELFNQFPCRLCVLDASDTLLDWSLQLEARIADDDGVAPSQQQLQHELTGLLTGLDGQRFDRVFLWDTLNHLHEAALPALAALLRRHVTAAFRGHGFLMQKRSADAQLRRMGLGGSDRIRLLEETPARLFVHTRKTVNETLHPDLSVDHAVLHGDGRLEYLLGA
jgi:hypothetical protein